MWNAESGKSFSIQWRCLPLPFSGCQRLYWYIFISNSASPFEKKLMDNLRKTSLLQSSSLCRHATLLLLGRSVAWWHKERLGSRLPKDVTVFSSNSFLPLTSRPLHQKGKQISKIQRVILQRSPRGRGRVKDAIWGKDLLVYSFKNMHLGVKELCKMFRSIPNNLLTGRKFVLICFKYIGEKNYTGRTFLFSFFFFSFSLLLLLRNEKIKPFTNAVPNLTVLLSLVSQPSEPERKATL